MPQYLKRRQLWRCNWCNAEFLFKTEVDSHACAVKAAVQRDERAAGRPLTFAETRAARDRARKTLTSS